MTIRWGVAFVLVGLLVAGLMYDQLVPLPAVSTEADVDALVVSPSMDDPPRLDGAWYCPVGSSSPGGLADHVVNISNLAEESAVASLTIITDSGPGPRRRIELEPLSTQRIELVDIQAAEVAGAVVEITGGRGAVGHTVTTAQGVAEGPCATEASSTWYFAGGRTARDAQEYLVLMNPFPETAVFDVEFQALGRSRTPGPLQGAFVEARSIKIIDVNRFVSREESLAAKVTTGRGRLVVERLQLLDGQLGPSGAALQLGVPAPAKSWMFTAGRVQTGGDDLLTIFNPYEPDPDATAAREEAAAAEREAADSSTDPTADGTGTTIAGNGDPSTSAGSELFDEEGTITVSVELWPSNPTDLSTYSVVKVEREIRPGTFATIDLRAQAERFEFPLPYELGVFVTSNEGLPIVAERWQYADRLVIDSLAGGGTAEEGTATDTTAVGDDTAAGDDTEAGDETAAGDGSTEEATVGDAGTEGLPLQAPEEVSGLPQPIATRGVSTTRGNELFSTRWVIPWVTMAGDSTVIAVASADEASIEVRTLAGGRWDGPFRAIVPAGGRAIIPVTSGAGGAAVEVISDVPVSVEAMVVVPDQSLDVVPAVPTVRQ